MLLLAAESYVGSLMKTVRKQLCCMDYKFMVRGLEVGCRVIIQFNSLYRYVVKNVVTSS